VLRVGVLGPLEVARDGAPVALAGNKERHLLAILAARANTVVSAGALAEELWGGRPPTTATKTLQTYVTRLRRTLEPDRPAGEAPEVLVTVGDGYVLRLPASALDALAFEQLVAAGREALGRGDTTAAGRALAEGLALWRGEAYGGLSGTGVVGAEAARLEELRLSALEVRIEADLARGRAGDLVGELEHLVGRHPLRERLWAHLMVALYRAERQSEALRAATRLRRLLQEELGLDPSPTVVDLEEAILRHDPVLDVPRDEASVRAVRVDSEDACLAPAVDVVSAGRSSRIELLSERTTVGKASENDIELDDPSVSHLHAVLERFAAGWCVTDLGSSNGTWLNGERIWSSRRLRHDDEIRIGKTRLLFCEPTGAAEPGTDVQGPPPPLTAGERDVLVALCRPLLAQDIFTEPTSTRSIADELVVSHAAVNQHLANLFDTFGIGADEADRRARLANDAISSGAVTIADLRGHPPT
jgi:DNA-binding SARP family transcriptional activator/pSer/pThr/pTyr-binding forkhead associated (FHA) protein